MIETFLRPPGSQAVTVAVLAVVMSAAIRVRREIEPPGCRPHPLGTGRSLGRAPGIDARRAAVVAGAIAVAILITPVVPLAVGLILAGRHRAGVRSRRQHRIRGVQVEQSMLLDLLCVATGAGLSLRQAIDRICRPDQVLGFGGELAERLVQATEDVTRGESFVDGLARIGDDPVIGPEVRQLTSTLAASERFGTPVAPALELLAEDVREARRRSAETAARRLPVRMLAPLVLLLLPAFALLTVAPLLAGGLVSLRLRP